MGTPAGDVLLAAYVLAAFGFFTALTIVCALTRCIALARHNAQVRAARRAGTPIPARHHHVRSRAA